MLPSYFAIVGTLINFIGVIGYIADTLRGKIKPNRVSFFLWSLAGFVAFAAQISQGVGVESLLVLSSGIIPFSIFLASFVHKNARWEVTRFDLACGLLSLIGLILWKITGEGNVAIVCSILADGLAAIPTVVKSFKYPDTELAWPWLVTVLAAVLTLLTLHEFTLANSGFVIYVFFINALIYGFVQFRIGEKITGK